MKAFIVVVTLFLTACGTMLKANIASFHDFQSSQIPFTYAVFPLDSQQGSLEYQAYVKQLDTELQAIRCRSVPLEQAEYVIIFVYGIDAGRNVSFSYPIFGQTGVSSSQTYGTVNTYGSTGTYSATTTYVPQYGVVGMGTGASTVYTRKLRLEILDVATLNSGKIRKVYEGEVVSAGSAGQLPGVMPTMLRALFRDFPGRSGQSRSVNLRIRQ